MGAQSFEDTRDLACVFIGQKCLQVTILEAADVELTANDGFKDGAILAVERLKPRCVRCPS